MFHGMINVYKEAGYTSHDVVARLRGIFKQKRIGHTGTLDPDAVGVLPVCLGSGTRLCDLLTDRRKEYVARLRLGMVTDTQDSSGRVLEEREVTASPQEVRRTILSFQGELLQVPPMYSALKVGGKKLCDLARAGKEVERAPRPISVYELEITEQAHPEYTIRVSCSKGTYIRTLCHDIGQALGCGAVMTALTRTAVGEFRIEDARTLKELEELAGRDGLSEAVIPVEAAFAALPALKAAEQDFKALRNGNQLKPERMERRQEAAAEADENKPLLFRQGEEFRVYSHEDIFHGVYRWQEERGMLVPVKMFLPEE